MAVFNKIENSLLKAKIEVMSKSVFISTIALSIKHIISDKVSTAATNGTTIWYNPKFIENLSIQEFAGLICHECWHIAFQHLFRRENRDPLIYNAAADYVINNMLIAAGFSIPAGGLINTKYHDMSTEQVYDELMKNQQQSKDDAAGMMKDLSDAPEEAQTDKEGNALSEQERQQAVQDIIVKANTQAILAGQDPGDLPGEVSRILKELVDPKLPWEALLTRFVDNTIKSDYTWARKNRRFKEYLPSMRTGGLAHLTFAIDTSGSVSDEDLKELLSEIQGIRDVFCPEKMTIIDCDSRINHIHEVDSSTNIMDLEFTGGGGTQFRPVLDYVNDHPTQALIYFTDLYGNTDLDEVDYPILWICNSDAEPACIGETIYINGEP